MTMPVIVSAIEQLPQDYLVPDELVRDLRRADDFIRMAVASAFSAVSRLTADKWQPEEVGVFIGTAYGPLETNFELLGSLIDDGEGQISPTLFSHSVYNAAAGYVARLLDIRGPAMTITNYSWPFLIALEEGRMAVASGKIGRAIVIGVETYSALLAEAYCRFLQVESVPWHKSALTWVLEPKGAAAGLCQLHGINIQEFDSDPADLLTRRNETFTCCGAPHELPRHPLAYATGLSEAVIAHAGSAEQQNEWSLAAPFGLARINLGK